MKILYFLEQFSNPSETFITDQIEWISKNGNEVCVLCIQEIVGPQNRDFRIKIVQYPNNLVNKIKSNLGSYGLYMNFYDPVYSRKISHFIAEFKPDIIHCHFGIQAFRLLDNLGSERIPAVITFHGYDATMMVLNNKAYRRKLKSAFLKPYIHPVFICDYHKELLQKIRIKSSHSQVIKLGVDVDFFKRRKSFPSHAELTFVQIGRLNEKKGHRYVLLALQKLLETHPNLKYIIAGNGPLLNELKALAQSLGIEKAVKFSGWLSRNEVKSTLENSNYFIHPSITDSSENMEGIPVSLMEAMAMELPVISTFHSGIPELVRDGENGFLVHEKDVAGLTKSMAKILGWGLMPINRDKILKMHNADIQNLKLLDHYKKVATITS